MPGVPVAEGYFTVPDDPAEPPRLLASRCPACGEHQYPRREVCARCLHVGCDDVELGPLGELFTWTWVHLPGFGDRRDGRGYGVGDAVLPEGPRVQARLLGGPGDFAIGMPVRLALEVVGADDDGTDLVVYRWEPAEAIAADEADEVDADDSDDEPEEAA